jgi:hypothetical protein
MGKDLRMLHVIHVARLLPVAARDPDLVILVRHVPSAVSLI